MNQAQTELDYFFQCGSCACNDGGVPQPKYLTLECPACGGEKVHRWPALPNLSREWSLCNQQGHQWAADRRDPSHEICHNCGADRRF